MTRSTRVLVWLICIVASCARAAAGSAFDVPAGPADAALLSLAEQAHIQILFSSDDLHQVRSNEVKGPLTADDALNRLLAGSAFAARKVGEGKYLVTKLRETTGAIRGRVVDEDGKPVEAAQVAIPALRRSVVTDTAGEFRFSRVVAGVYEIAVRAEGYHALDVHDAHVAPGKQLMLEPQTLYRVTDPARLAPFIVEAKPVRSGLFDGSDSALAVRTATGNIDLFRTENDPLPYEVYGRDKLIGSGVVDLNEFLQRELIDANATARPPEQDETQPSYAAGSTNLSLRGYTADETVVLVNGRRLPEIITSGGGPNPPPDVNFIPLSLVQEVQVLPVSASALYTGNPVGGVINIVLRPQLEANATELTLTYTNALAGYDAPQEAASLLHGETLLQGKLHLRFNASFTRAMPPTEADLRYHEQHDTISHALDQPIFRATPNIRSADGSPLFGPGTSSVTSVAPGSTGAATLTSFMSREGVRDFAFYDPPGGLASSLDSIDYPYGRRQHRATYYGSVSYDVFPWLEIGVDGTYGQTVVNRGYDVFTGDLLLRANSPFNPFGKDVYVSLNETAPKLGQDYSEARLDFSSVLVGILVRGPANWQASLDTQYAHNTARYRGLAGADPTRWQQAVDDGEYNPLRDTQVSPPPQSFYDRVLTYRGGVGQFVTVGDYDAADVAFRVTNSSLFLPTGQSNVEVGADYRINHLANYNDQEVFADGTLAQDPIRWSGRTLQRYSVFGELRAPLLPESWLPHWLKKAEMDGAVRYIAADNSEANVAPTYAMKVDFAGGFSLRGSVTYSNRFPSPVMSHRIIVPTGATGSGPDQVSIYDPKRNERYTAIAEELIDPNLRPEAAVTQTAGLVYQHGRTQRLRFSIDFVDTRKTNELQTLDAPALMNLEQFFPDRVVRGPETDGLPGRVQTIYTGETNIAWRHSQNWNLMANYARDGVWGGTVDVYSRWLYFPKYDRQLLPTSARVDELRAPDESDLGLMKFRSNFGASWTGHVYGFGVEGHFFGSREIPRSEWPAQGGSQVASFLQFDTFVQCDLLHFLPWKARRFDLHGQLRVNNIFDRGYPAYASDPSGAGVQPYGDWRGRVYSMSLTASY